MQPREIGPVQGVLNGGAVIALDGHIGLSGGEFAATLVEGRTSPQNSPQVSLGVVQM